MSAAVHCERCANELTPDALFCPMCGAPRLRPDGDALIGSIIADRYLLQRRMGHGASGNIYQAEHVTVRRRVAVKVLHHELSADDLAVERFRREATTVGQIDNEHIVEVYDFGRMGDGRLFLAMEFLEGETLKDALEREGRLPVPRVVDVLIQLGEALMEAHAMGYIHRDLRPRNVFLARRRGQDGYVKLLDFGLSKLVEREGEAASTSLGMTFGDPHYMSPEQAQGEPVDRRCDIYSLGCIGYQMLVGQPPFVGEKVFDVLTQHIENTPRAPSAFRPDVPAWLDQVLGRMLAKSAEERFVTVYRMVEALREGRDTGKVMSDDQARRAMSVPPPAPAPRSRETGVVRVLSAAETSTIGAQSGPNAAVGGGPPPAAPPLPSMLAATPPGAQPSAGSTLPGAVGPAKAAAAATAPPAAAPSGEQAAPGVSGMWFADGEALEEDARRAEAGTPAAPRKNGAAKPAWSQEFEYADPDRKRKLVVAAVVGGVALLLIVGLLIFSGGGDKPKPEEGAALAANDEAADAGGAGQALVPPPAASDAAPAAVLAADAGVVVAETPADAAVAEAKGPDPKPDPKKKDPKGPKNGGGGGGGGGDGGDGNGDPVRDRDGTSDATNADAAQADFYVKVGRQALAKGDAVGAATNFNKAREFDPKNADAIGGLGEVAMQQGYYDDAIVHLEAATRLAPRSSRLWGLLGQAYQGAGRNGKAAAAYKKALKLDPGNAAARRGFEETSGQ